MGWESLPRVTEALRSHGLSADTPAALIQWGTRPDQKVVEGTLGTVLDQGQKAGLEPPMVAVIGPVVKLRERVRWFDDRPLFGRRIMVTRSRTQTSRIAELLAIEGAEPVELPSIRILPVEDDGPLRQTVKGLDAYQWIVFSSVNGVEAFWQALDAEGLDARALAGVQVSAIGPATAELLLQHGIRADSVPTEYVSDASVFPRRGLPSGWKVTASRTVMTPSAAAVTRNRPSGVYFA